jgi:3-oxoacyl-[acyl-carrier protein] reductase
MDLQFEDRNVLVTGASSGIGAAIAEGFARAGARVGVHYHRGAESAEALVTRVREGGADAFVLQADLSEPGAAETLTADFLEECGTIDVLVNNAGAMLRRMPVADADDEHYGMTFELNFGSVFTMCRAVIPAMRGNGGGAIVNVSSVAARTGGGGNAVLYAAAKGAVATFSRGLAGELVGDGIRVNSLEPGLIDTGFHANVTAASDFERMASGVPMRRAGRPEDCVGAVLFLASDEAAGYITGQAIGVNGGLVMA